MNNIVDTLMLIIENTIALERIHRNIHIELLRGYFHSEKASNNELNELKKFIVQFITVYAGLRDNGMSFKLIVIMVSNLFAPERCPYTNYDLKDCLIELQQSGEITVTPHKTYRLAS